MIKIVVFMYIVYYVFVAFATTQAMTKESCDKGLKTIPSSPITWPMIDGCVIKTIEIKMDGE